MRKRKLKPKTYTHKTKGLLARLVNFFLTKVLIKKLQFIFHNGEPDSPSVLVSNHTALIAPLSMQYMYPDKIRTWSNGKLIDAKLCYDMLKNEVLVGRHNKLIYKLLLPMVSPLIAYYFRVTFNSIPVYHDLRIAKTLKESIATLEQGVHLAIYPEQKEPAINEILCPFASGFTYIAYSYYMETGKLLKFYPIYYAFSLKQVHIGNPIEYNPEIDIKKQSLDITAYLEDAIVQLARDLPAHKIFHYEKAIK